MVAKIQIIECIHGFIIVLNSQNQRMNDKIQDMFNVLKKMFQDLIGNLAVVFTHWVVDIKYKKQNQEKQEKHTNKFNEFLQEKGILSNSQRIKCFYINNEVEKYD